MFSDINLGQIKNDKNYNFLNKYDEDKEIFSNNYHSCDYYEMEGLNNKFSRFKDRFSTYSHNIRSINGHWEDFLDIIDSIQPHNFSVIALQEIWSVQKTYSIPGYEKLEFLTRDKNGPPNPNCGGGVGLFVHSKFKDYEILNNESIFIPHVYESIWIKIKMKQGADKIIGNIYRPNTAPRANLEQAIEIHSQILDKILNDESHRNCDIQILSDFNLNMLNFETHNLTNDYINLLISKSFLPVITLPTRVKQQSATLIDHIWTNKVTTSYKSGIILNSLSDHFPVVYFEEGKQQKIQLPDNITRKIDSNTILSFCNLLKSTSWSNVLREPDPKNAFTNFFEKINSARDLAFPEIRVKSKLIKFKHNPWMSQGLKISKKQKDRLCAKKVKRPTEGNINSYKRFNKVYNKVRRAAKKLYYEKQFKKFTNDSKKTWSVIKEVIGSSKQKDQLPNFFSKNNQIINDSLEIANGFNTFFAGIGPKLASEIQPSDINYETFLSDRNPNSFQFSRISEIDILGICRKLKPKLSSGADFISTKLLKDIAPLIITPLHYLINLSLETGYVPKEFKVAKIVPVFKEGDCHDFNNYRPISLLSSFSKLMEKIVAKQLLRFLHIHNIIYKHQYGFRAKHNTSHPVLQFSEKIYNALNQKPSAKTLAIFIDLKKAFDTVDHTILLNKMAHYGIRNAANTWFRNYLDSREQFVTINGIQSVKKEIICGVPQGSVLGPLLFLIFINDLPNSTQFLTLLFADDTTFQISGVDTDQLFMLANSELEKSSVWFRANKLTLNVKKTKYMIFSDQNLTTIPNKLQIGSQIIEQVGTNCKEKYFKFVGHVIDDKFSWEGHVQHITKKLASANFGINSSKNFLPMQIRKTLYYSLFESHLNFGNLLWGCANKKSINKIENLQKKCIRNVALKNFRAHTEPIFKNLGILKFTDKLSYCRSVFMHQYRHGKLPPSFTGIFRDTTMSDKVQSRHNDYNYLNEPAVKKCLEKFPLKQIIFNWNSLDIDLKATGDLEEFQSMLHVKLLSQYNYDTDCSLDCFSCNHS